MPGSKILLFSPLNDFRRVFQTSRTSATCNLEIELSLYDRHCWGLLSFLKEQNENKKKACLVRVYSSECPFTPTREARRSDVLHASFARGVAQDDGYTAQKIAPAQSPYIIKPAVPHLRRCMPKPYTYCNTVRAFRAALRAALG